MIKLFLLLLKLLLNLLLLMLVFLVMTIPPNIHMPTIHASTRILHPPNCLRDYHCNIVHLYNFATPENSSNILIP